MLTIDVDVTVGVIVLSSMSENPTQTPCTRDTNVMTGSAVDVVEAVTVPPSTVDVYDFISRRNTAQDKQGPTDPVTVDAGTEINALQKIVAELL